VDEEDNEKMYKVVSREESLISLNTFQNDKSFGQDGWTTEFYLEFFELIEEDLLRVVEEVTLLRKVLGSIKSSFIALVPKCNCLESFDGFRTISLCNCVYKIISKIIAIRLNPILSRLISLEKFGFLERRKIHEAIVSSQEGLHTTLSQCLVVVIKLDLSKNL
jgi:hypothetical protein